MKAYQWIGIVALSLPTISFAIPLPELEAIAAAVGDNIAKTCEQQGQDIDPGQCMSASIYLGPKTAWFKYPIVVTRGSYNDAQNKVATYFVQNSIRGGYCTSFAYENWDSKTQQHLESAASSPASANAEPNNIGVYDGELNAAGSLATSLRFCAPKS